MPVYEFQCNACGRVAALTYSYDEYDRARPTCPHCGAGDMARVISRVTVARSEESRMDALADPSAFGGLDSDDPRELGRAMRRMGRELGEDVGGEFHEVVDRLEAGESPESIEQSMPDLGSDLPD